MSNFLFYHFSCATPLVSYNRFIELIPQTLMPLILYLNCRDVEVTVISFIDSTPIPICHAKRAKRNKVFSGLLEFRLSNSGIVG
ncbi:MAG: hypothetical protein F6K41_37045 [Symploca sp. SIO3E6]|nr:hypothetical protein [Caldora sp. SIO3E6]